MYYILFYDYVENIVEKRSSYREAHLRLTATFVQSGEIILGGAFSNPTDGAAIIFKVEDIARIEAFISHDPYVQNNLVTKWEIREWTVVVGAAL
ncbi:MAG: YciI-like protein [Sulfurospirillaceae bacterium]|nr:YciI-like protein [Sulfurospirillaceae bacterium]